MRAAALSGFALLAAAAACAPPKPATGPLPLKPENGPRAAVEAWYSGGIVYRTVNARFRVSERAFVIVAHLGGDGVIRVLYPEVPNQFVSVPANRTISTQPFNASYDGAPALYTFRVSPFRSSNAMMDSYDGRGHGFIFMIATRSPMHFDRLSNGYDWDEVVVRDYFQALDPRPAIRDFAEMLTRGTPYTLRFANTFTTQSLTNYASNAADCDVLGSLGFRYTHRFWGSWGLYDVGSYHALTPQYGSWRGCGPAHYASRAFLEDYYAAAWRRGRIAYDPQPWTPTTTSPTTPPPLTPTLTRPTQRAFGERGVNVGRSALDRSPATRASALQRRPSTDNAYRPVTYRDPPSGRDYGAGRSNSYGGQRRDTGAPTQTGGGDRSGASQATPRASSPAPTSRPASPPPRATSSTTETTRKHQ